MIGCGPITQKSVNSLIHSHFLPYIPFSLSQRYHHPHSSLTVNNHQQIKSPPHMINDRWLSAAVTTDALVADLLLRLKQQSSSDSSPPPTTAAAPPLNRPPGWGDRKSRSKLLVSVKGQQQRSPSTPLCWSGGGGGGDGGEQSTRDGYDEFSRPYSDLYSGIRSVKVDLHQNTNKKGCESGLETEKMKRKRFMLPDLNEKLVYE